VLADVSDFYESKFRGPNSVRAGWSMAVWIAERVSDIPKTPSPVVAIGTGNGRRVRTSERCGRMLATQKPCAKRIGHTGSCQSARKRKANDD
jgi:hypothetical protein